MSGVLPFFSVILLEGLGAVWGPAKPGLQQWVRPGWICSGSPCSRVNSPQTGDGLSFEARVCLAGAESWWLKYNLWHVNWEFTLALVRGNRAVPRRRRLLENGFGK